MAAESTVRRILRSAVASGRWERPFLLVGLGEARDAAAEEFLRAVLCEAREGGDGRACGACGSCGRVRRGIHPDHHRLLPEKGRVTVGVEAVEALQSLLSLRSVEGRGTAVLVPGAEALTPQAQNALLKTLEEPPPGTALVLTAAAPRSLLPTLRSRCVGLRLPPVPAAEVLAAAGGSAALAAAAGWDPVRLPRAVEEGAAEAAVLLERAFAPRAPGGDPLEGLEPAAAWVKGKGGPLEPQRERLRMALRILLAAPGSPAPAALRRRLAALGEARERVERNVDPAGILEALSVSFRAGDGVPLKSGPPSRRSM